ncbi:hypothetical protein [Amycolatopsis australiensis]|nr:hypothetical protein [Amycolatopsis australiensis]
MMLTEPEPDDTAPWTDATRARLAVSLAARELADSLIGWVPIPPAELTITGGQHRPLPDRTSIDDADRLRSRVEDFVELVAVYEMVSGATWEMLGDDLGISRQSAHRRYAEALDRFKGALLEAEDGVEGSFRLPEGADNPEYWGPRLDKWYRERRRPSDPAQQDDPVSGGMTRLHPHIELMRLQRRRSRLLGEYLVPPAEKILPIAERELVLWKQLGEAGHDVADAIERLQRQIAELRATTVADAGADS